MLAKKPDFQIRRFCLKQNLRGHLRCEILSEFHAEYVRLSVNQVFSAYTFPAKRVGAAASHSPSLRRPPAQSQAYAQKIHHPATHCAPNISGIPRRNFQCLVLWRNICIPAIAPMLPPAAAKRKRVFSGTRQPLFLAWRLSCPNTQNVTIFMSIIYTANICVMAIESLSL